MVHDAFPSFPPNKNYKLDRVLDAVCARLGVADII